MTNKVLTVLAVLVVVLGGAFVFLRRDNESENGTGPQVNEVEVVEDAAESNSRKSVSSPGEEATEAVPESGVRVVSITGRNFEFTEEMIEVKLGEKVRIEFSNEEGFHNWTVAGFDAATEKIEAGKTSSVEFVADKAGEYEFYCSVGNHRDLGMVGVLVVSE